VTVRIERVDPGRHRAAFARLDRVCGFEACEPVSRGALWWAALDGRDVVAYAAAVIVPRDVVYLARCGVLPAYRGAGVQRRMIAVRKRVARREAALDAVTYTLRDNLASANNLIAAGFRLYTPAYAWAGRDVLYWMFRVR